MNRPAIQTEAPAVLTVSRFEPVLVVGKNAWLAKPDGVAKVADPKLV